jgi:L-fuculokinase
MYVTYNLQLKMPVQPVIAVFDIGKTNKKLFLFNENYQIVWEKSIKLPEIIDEDGDPCEDIYVLKSWLQYAFTMAMRVADYQILAVNAAAYGASFVYLDEKRQIIAPLYNYLKPFPADLKEQFYSKYGNQEDFARCTASPILESLNSGLQIYRFKYQQKALFERMKYALHLPQYVTSIFAGKGFSEITSVGCHTALWDFDRNNYHDWVIKEDILPKFPAFIPGFRPSLAWIQARKMNVGSGLHDSSSALIPYLACFDTPFLLISTGTWCIAMNPFNKNPLTAEELKQDCLCYMTYKGEPVKASRAFLGAEHEQATKEIATIYTISEDFFKEITFDALIISALQSGKKPTNSTEAYHQLMLQLIEKQVKSIHLVLQDTPIERIFIDGGFSKNEIYMQLLAQAFPKMQVYAASVAQATALGAAMAIHPYWNVKALRKDLIELKLMKI